MKKKFSGILVLVAVLFSFALMCNVAWAFKNTCPECNKTIENLDLTACPDCGKIINKCLNCQHINPIKNDNCENCSATLAESRVLRTIDKETRQDLQLGESPRAKIVMELGQIEERASIDGMTPELGARQVELLIEMGWWSKANTQAIEFTSLFPEAAQNAQVAAFRVTALRGLGYLALQERNKPLARQYLKTALSIDPKDSKSLYLLRKAGGAK